MKALTPWKNSSTAWISTQVLLIWNQLKRSLQNIIQESRTDSKPHGKQPASNGNCIGRFCKPYCSQGWRTHFWNLRQCVKKRYKQWMFRWSGPVFDFIQLLFCHHLLNLAAGSWGSVPARSCSASSSPRFSCPKSMDTPSQREQQVVFRWHNMLNAQSLEWTCGYLEQKDEKISGLGTLGVELCRNSLPTTCFMSFYFFRSIVARLALRCLVHKHYLKPWKNHMIFSQ